MISLYLLSASERIISSPFLLFSSVPAGHRFCSHISIRPDLFAAQKWSIYLKKFQKFVFRSKPFWGHCPNFNPHKTLIKPKKIGIRSCFFWVYSYWHYQWFCFNILRVGIFKNFLSQGSRNRGQHLNFNWKYCKPGRHSGLAGRAAHPDRWPVPGHKWKSACPFVGEGGKNEIANRVSLNENPWKKDESQ